MFAREAIQRVQRDGTGEAAIDGFLPNRSLLGLSDTASLARWIVSTQRANRPRASLLEALRADNRESIGSSKSISEAVDAIERGGRVVVVSHQPTMLPYTGVFAQFFLAHLMAAKLGAIEGRPAAVVYLCLDSDDAFDRRIKTAHVPTPAAHGGRLSISAAIGDSFVGSVQCRVPPLDSDSIVSWISAIRGSFGRCVYLAPHRRSELLTARDLVTERLSRLFGNAIAHANNFADLSRSILLDFVEEVTGTRTLFLRLTTAVANGQDTFRNLLGQFDKIHSSAIEASAMLGAHDIQLRSQGLVSTEAAWLICDACGRRSSLDTETALRLMDEPATKTCNWCGADVTPDHSPGWLVPRILVEDLFGAAFTDASLVLTYAGSAEHVLLTQWTSPEVLGRPSPIYTWHPRHQLGDVIEKTAIDLCTRFGSARADAVEALRLSWNGRDSLVHCLGTPRLLDYGNSWRTFLATEPLNDPMICGEPADIPVDLATSLS
jgi:hypothetical protein